MPQTNPPMRHDKNFANPGWNQESDRDALEKQNRELKNSPGTAPDSHQADGRGTSAADAGAQAANATPSHTVGKTPPPRY